MRIASLANQPRVLDSVTRYALLNNVAILKKDKYKVNKMSRPIDKGWITLTVTRIVSIGLAIFAVVLLIGTISLFHSASHDLAGANAHPNAAEDQPHGLDALGAIFEGGFGAVVLLGSIVIFILAFTMFFGTSWKLRKKAALANQQSQNQAQVVMPQPQQTTTPPLDNKITETTGNEVVDNNQQRAAAEDQNPS